MSNQSPLRPTQPPRIHGEGCICGDNGTNPRCPVKDSERPAPPHLVGELPCPFCGSNSLTRTSSFIHCKTCGADGPLISRRYSWNDRAAATETLVKGRAVCGAKDVGVFCKLPAGHAGEHQWTLTSERP